MRASRFVNTLSVTPIAEMRNMGVSAIWMRWAMSTDWTVYEDKLPRPFIPASIPNPLSALHGDRAANAPATDCSRDLLVATSRSGRRAQRRHVYDVAGRLARGRAAEWLDADS